MRVIKMKNLSVKSIFKQDMNLFKFTALYQRKKKALCVRGGTVRLLHTIFSF